MVSLRSPGIYTRVAALLLILYLIKGLIVSTIAREPSIRHSSPKFKFITENQHYEHTSRERDIPLYQNATTRASDINNISFSQAILGSAQTKCNNSMKRENNVYLLKMAKTGSSTLWGIISRFAWRNGLRFATYRDFPFFSQAKSPIVSELIPEFRDDEKYNIICDHTVFSQADIERVLYPPIDYITFVRHPLSWLRSYLHYQKLVTELELHNFTDPVIPFVRKLTSDSAWKGRNTHILNDIKGWMLKAFGGISNSSLNDLLLSTNIFSVGIYENYDLALMILKRELGWSLQDMIYVPLRVQKHYKVSSEDQELYDTYCKWNTQDCFLYEHLKSRFWQVVGKSSGIVEEAENYKRLNKEISNYCVPIFKSLKSRKYSKNITDIFGTYKATLIGATPWNGAFSFTAADCAFSKLRLSVIRAMFYYRQNPGASCPYRKPCPIISTGQRLCVQVCEALRSNSGNAMDRILSIRRALFWD